MRLWVAHKKYDLDQMKTVITEVEIYNDYVRSGNTLDTRNVDIVWAIDAMGAWKAAKEKHDERD